MLVGSGISCPCHNSFNPIEEWVEDQDDEIVDHIVSCYTVVPTLQRGYETDEDEMVEQEISMKDAMTALRTLQLYEEQQTDGDTELLQHLHKQERLMKAREMTGKQQCSITSYFS